MHDNQQEIKGIIEQSISEITPDILGEAESFEFEKVRLSDSGRLADIRQVFTLSVLCVGTKDPIFVHFKFVACLFSTQSIK